MIQCHDNFNQVLRLISWLFHPADYFIISLDLRVGQIPLALEGILKLPNVKAAPRHTIVWGGASIVSATKSAMLLALDLPNWEYFINLSGLDIPLLSRQDLCARLETAAANGIYNFLSDFGTCNVNFEAWDGDPEAICKTLTAPNSARILACGSVAYLSKGPSHASFKPVVEPQLRAAFHVSQFDPDKTLSCRPLFRFELKERQTFFLSNPYRFGRQWVILHRSVCEQTITAPACRELSSMLNNIFIPDESFFQMAIAVLDKSVRYFSFTKDNKRFNFGAPCVLSDDNIRSVLSSGSWFARKLELTRCQQTVEIISAIMGGNRSILDGMPEHVLP